MSRNTVQNSAIAATPINIAKRDVVQLRTAHTVVATQTPANTATPHGGASNDEKAT